MEAGEKNIPLLDFFGWKNLLPFRSIAPRLFFRLFFLFFFNGNT